MTYFKKDPLLGGGSKLFIAVVRQAKRVRDTEFLTGNGILKLGLYLGVNMDLCEFIRRKFITKLKEIKK